LPEGRFVAWLRRLLMSTVRMSSRACAAPVGGLRVGDDRADVAAYRWCDADGADVRGDRAQAHRGEYGDAGPVLDEFGQVLHVLRFADGAPGESGGGAATSIWAWSPESAR
jgi:hypothetical protein